MRQQVRTGMRLPTGELPTFSKHYVVTSADDV